MDLTSQVNLFGSDQSLQPPDTQLAAGPSNIAEADNDTLSVWSRTGSLTLSADLNVFFGVPRGFSFSDPRILYDAASSRWFLTGLAFDNFGDSDEYIAVSTSTDASASWNVYQYASGTRVLGDQPMPGVNSDKVVVSWNDFSPKFSGQETWVLQKSDLVSGLKVHISTFGPDTTRFRIVPAISLTNTSTEWMAYNNADCPATCNQGSPTVGVVEINGTPLDNDVTWGESDPAVAAISVPPNPRQPGGTPLDTQIDDRFLSATTQNAALWVAGNDGCTPPGDSTTRSCMRFIEISIGGPVAVLNDFDASSNGFDLFYPAVTQDPEGDLFVAYSESSSSLFPSAFGVDSRTTSPTTFENVVTLGAGQTSYSGGSHSRWGDYSAAVRDPVFPADVWLTAEYQPNASSPGDWGTATARVAMQPAITAITPNSSPVNLAQAVVIGGTNFQSGATVRFGGVAATGVNVLGAGLIDAIAPKGLQEGPVAVTISQPDGTTVTDAAAYTYTREAVDPSASWSPPSRGSVSPSSPAPPGPRLSSG